MMEIKIKIEGEFIRMDSLMKLSGMVSMGGEAKHFIQDGQVKLNGQVCKERSKGPAGDSIGICRFEGYSGVNT